MNKKILITGGGGFIGHNFIKYVLANTDWDIIATYRKNTKRISFTMSDRITYIYMDLSKNIYLDLCSLDYVVHIASEADVDDSLDNCIPFVLSNVLGTANLLQWLKNNHPQARTCIFSSGEVMGTAPDGVYFKETDLRKPSNPYAATKASMEMLAYSFAHSFNMPIFVIRCMNVFGESEKFDKFIPKTFKSIKENKKIVLHGTSPDNVASRPWIYVNNVSDAILFLLDKASSEEIYHIAGSEKDVYSMAALIYRIVKKKEMPIDAVEFINFHVTRPGHDKRYGLSIKKLIDMGWEFKSDLDTDIKYIINYFENIYNSKEESD